MLYYLTRILKKKGLFKRERRSTEIRALAIVLYFSGLSFRDVSKILRAMGFKASYEAVRNWYHRCKDIFNVERKRRKYVAIDETVIKAGKKFYYVWVAVDVERMEVISARISRGKGNLECLEMIMLEKCKNLVDRAPWYKEVLSRRGLKYEIRTRGKRNAVESWFFQVEEEGEELLQKVSG